MTLIKAVAGLAFIVGLASPSQAYPVVHAACINHVSATCANGIGGLSVRGAHRDLPPVVVPWAVPGAAMPIVFNGYVTGSDLLLSTGADMPPSLLSLADARPATLGADALFANADTLAPAPTTATLALAGLALVALGRSRRNHTVLIKLG